MPDKCPGGISGLGIDEAIMLSASSEKREITHDMEDDDEFDPELKQPVIKTVSKAEEHGEQLTDFAEFNGHEELSLHSIKLCGLKAQPAITDSVSLPFKCYIETLNDEVHWQQRHLHCEQYCTVQAIT